MHQEVWWGLWWPQEVRAIWAPALTVPARAPRHAGGSTIFGLGSCRAACANALLCSAARRHAYKSSLSTHGGSAWPRGGKRGLIDRQPALK